MLKQRGMCVARNMKGTGPFDLYLFLKHIEKGLRILI